MLEELQIVQLSLTIEVVDTFSNIDTSMVVLTRGSMKLWLSIGSNPTTDLAIADHTIARFIKLKSRPRSNPGLFFIIFIPKTLSESVLPNPLCFCLLPNKKATKLIRFNTLTAFLQISKNLKHMTFKTELKVCFIPNRFSIFRLNLSLSLSEYSSFLG